jgi:hypothetical protein
MIPIKSNVNPGADPGFQVRGGGNSLLTNWTMLINIKPEMITILLHMLKRHIILQTMNEECLKTVVSHFKYKSR